MVWFNVDDNLHDHPKARAAGLEAMGLWALCGSFSAQYLTEGFVPEWKVFGFKNGKKLAEKLVSTGLWIPVIRDGEPGYLFHQWEERNRTKAQVEADRAANRVRQQRRRARVSNGVTPPVTNAVSNAALAIPSQANIRELRP